MCEPGTGEENLERCLRSINPIFLRNVYNSLGELFKVQEEEEERLGYKYAKTPDNIQEIAAPDYPDPDKHWSMNKPRIAEKS